MAEAPQKSPTAASMRRSSSTGQNARSPGCATGARKLDLRGIREWNVIVYYLLAAAGILRARTGPVAAMAHK
jgi:hypothetical protein